MNLTHERILVIAALLQTGASKASVVATLSRLLGLDMQTGVSVLREQVVRVQGCYRVVEGQVLERYYGDSFILSNGDRAVHVNDDFLNRCAPEMATAIREAIARF